MKRKIYAIMRGRYVVATFLYKSEAVNFCKDMKKIFNLEDTIQETFIYG